MAKGATAYVIPVLLALAHPAALAQGLANTAVEADAEAQRLQAAAAAMRQRADALRQLETADRALQAANVEVAEPQTAAPETDPVSGSDTDADAPQGDANTARGGGASGGSGSGARRDGRQEFGGLEFGVGISFTLDVGTDDRVSEAEVVNGIVRVTDENNGVARIMLESHYLFTTEYLSFLGLEPGRWGHGPFVALQPGTDDIIEAIGMGWMLGFRRPTPQGEEDTGQSFNLGLGVVIDPNTRVLGDGIVANAPLPTGETGVRYREEMQTGVLILASFSF